MSPTTRLFALWAASLGLSAIGFGQGFVDHFDSIDPAWHTDRYEPAGFTVSNFDGGNRLKIDISASDDYQNRTGGFQDIFYNTQGRQRQTTLSTAWTVSGDVFISDDFLGGDNLRRTDLWARDSNTTENAARYPIFGVVRNDGADPQNPAGSLTTRYRVWNDASGWIDLANTVTGGWHNLAITSTGASFVYSLDGSVVYTDNTTSAPGFSDLSTVFVQAYNFGDASHNVGQSYSVYWDNITAAPVPEPASIAAIGLGVVGLIRRRRARQG